MAVERGEKRGRLHLHAIVWSRQLAEMKWYSMWKLMYEKWTHGNVTATMVRNKSAFGYTAKYIVKDLAECVDIKTGEIRKQRLYTWSNKPGLGQSGIELFRKLVESWEGQSMPPNNIKVPILGKLTKVYIPQGAYMRVIKDIKKVPTRDWKKIIAGDPWAERIKTIDVIIEGDIRQSIENLHAQLEV